MVKPRKKLGSYLIAAFFINIFAIMSVGALCILLVSDILGNIKEDQHRKQRRLQDRPYQQQGLPDHLRHR